MNNNTGQQISTRKRTWTQNKGGVTKRTQRQIGTPAQSNRTQRPPEQIRPLRRRPVGRWLLEAVGRAVYILGFALCWRVSKGHKNDYTFCLLRRVQFFHSNRRIWAPVFIALQLHPGKGSSACDEPAGRQLHQRGSQKTPEHLPEVRSLSRQDLLGLALRLCLTWLLLNILKHCNMRSFSMVNLLLNHYHCTWSLH